jgi:hypothetical protein
VTTPIVGSAEAFTVEVLTELGAIISQSALAHVAINDDNLAGEATELPQLIFYYQAAWARLSLREEQSEIALKEAEANVYVGLKSRAEASSEKIPVDEIKMRIRLDPVVAKLTRDGAELRSKRDIVRGILDALRQKGYSIQMLGNIRAREEDWLRNSFADRFANHPNRDRIAQVLNQVLGDKFVS